MVLLMLVSQILRPDGIKQSGQPVDIYIYMLPPPPPGPTFSECSSTSPRGHDDPLLTTVICIPTQL